MGRLDPTKLHVEFLVVTSLESPLASRHYTLTHSDSTGDLFLTIAPEVSSEQISSWYTRLMRDEVVAEWKEGEDGPALHVYCHVSGGFVVGSAAMRNSIFQRELPLVLEAFRTGDGEMYERRPELDRAPILVHFHSTYLRYHRTERWGTPSDYRV